MLQLYLNFRLNTWLQWIGQIQLLNETRKIYLLGFGGRNIRNLKVLKTVCMFLTHWGQVTHICVSKLTIIGSNNGLSPGRHQAIIWTKAGLLLIGPLETNCSEILIVIMIFPFKKMRLKVSSAKWRPFCLGLNVLRIQCAWQENGLRCGLASYIACLVDTMSYVVKNKARCHKAKHKVTSMQDIFISWMYSYIHIRRTKSQNLNVCRLDLQLSLLNRLKPGVKTRMKV